MFVTDVPGSENRYDVVLVGAGIMSATLAVLLHELEPDLRLLMVERLSSPGLESSAAKNNAGTGHAANCELNYTPLLPGGLVSTDKALKINRSFCRLELVFVLHASKREIIKLQFCMPQTLFHYSCLESFGSNF